MVDTSERFTVCMCFDKLGDETTAAREDLMEIHLAYVETIMDRIVLAGPLFDDAGEGVIGSMLIYNTGDPAEARALLGADPYFKAGFWADVKISTLFPAAGSAVGGKAW